MAIVAFSDRPPPPLSLPPPTDPASGVTVLPAASVVGDGAGLVTTTTVVGLPSLSVEVSDLVSGGSVVSGGLSPSVLEGSSFLVVVSSLGGSGLVVVSGSFVGSSFVGSSVLVGSSSFVVVGSAGSRLLVWGFVYVRKGYEAYYLCRTLLRFGTRAGESA